MSSKIRGMAMERRCLNCMNKFKIPAGLERENNICPFCGFVENTPARNLSYLNPGYILKERYKIGTVVGAGGFGITYKAWDKILDNIVAIKEYFPRGVVSRNGNATVSVYENQRQSFMMEMNHFLNEARSLARFNSIQGTVVIHDFFEANGTAYIVMEYLDGWNLRDYTERNGEKLTREMIFKMIETICGALSEVHSVGLIHRDISPDNIFLCKSGHFKLIDFGTVRYSSASGNINSEIVLKHGYAPIEQYTQNGSIGPWTDIYAFAATIYKLLTDVMPPAAVDRITFDELMDLSALNPNVTVRFSSAIMKALSVQIQDRYQDVETFKRDLLADIQILNTSQLIQDNDLLRNVLKDQGFEEYGVGEYSTYSEILRSNQMYQDQLQAKLADPDTEKKSNGSDKTKLILGICIGVVVVLAVALGIVLLS